MKCPLCSIETVHSKGRYHYTESGLDNVFLEGVDIDKCPECGEEFVTIPCVPELHDLIGKEILKKKSLLNGKEIRFFRKNIGLSSMKFAKMIGVNIATVSRWEAEDQTISTLNDRLMRLLYSNMKDIPPAETKSLIVKAFELIVKAVDKQPEMVITVPDLSSSCLIHARGWTL